MMNKETKKNIGLVVAIETDAVFEIYKDCKELKAPKGFREYLVERDEFILHIVKTGMGEIAASAGTEYLVAKYGVDAIFNFGVVGGLTQEMSKMKICYVNSVVHYKYDCSEFMNLQVGQVDGHDSIFLNTSEKFGEIAERLGILPVTCCSGDKFVSTAQEKEYLHNKFSGDICDMESAGIVLTCEINDIPCLLLKIVSDGLNDGAEGFYSELKKASLECLKTVNEVIGCIVT